MQYFVLLLNGSNYYLKYMFNTTHILASMDTSTSLVAIFNAYQLVDTFSSQLLFPFATETLGCCILLALLQSLSPST